MPWQAMRFTRGFRHRLPVSEIDRAVTTGRTEGFVKAIAGGGRCWGSQGRPGAAAMVEDHIAMRRAGGAEEMAAVFAFVCSGDAACITGQVLFVDGGLTLYRSFEATWSSG